MLLKKLKTVSILALSGLLLGSAFSSSSWAMIKDAEIPKERRPSNFLPKDDSSDRGQVVPLVPTSGFEKIPVIVELDEAVPAGIAKSGGIRLFPVVDGRIEYANALRLLHPGQTRTIEVLPSSGLLITCVPSDGYHIGTITLEPATITGWEAYGRYVVTITKLMKGFVEDEEGVKEAQNECSVKWRQN